MLATPPRQPLGTPAAPARPAELRETPVLLLDDGHCFRDQALSVCSRARVRESEFRATSLSTLAQMVAGGAGVTLLPGARGADRGHAHRPARASVRGAGTPLHNRGRVAPRLPARAGPASDGHDDPRDYPNRAATPRSSEVMKS